ncbi:hypothetical protein J6590_088879 [Homalodisca vitripennis]|nr:hypothetical protein J6590_088879 [Homalodisca vitripennis]
MALCGCNIILSIFTGREVNLFRHLVASVLPAISPSGLCIYGDTTRSHSTENWKLCSLLTGCGAKMRSVHLTQVLCLIISETRE